MDVRTLPLALVLMGACSTPCDLEACAAACETLNVPVRMPLDPAPPHVLDAAEAYLLADEIADLRAGATIEPGGTGVCGGAEGPCGGFSRVEEDPRLPPGPHRLTLAYRTPRRAIEGDWHWRATSLCAGPSNGTVVEVANESKGGPLPPTQGGTARLELMRVGEGVLDGRCAWTVAIAGREGTTREHDGGFLVASTAGSSPPEVVPARSPLPAEAPVDAPVDVRPP